MSISLVLARMPDGDECKVYLSQRQPYELQHQCGGSYIGDGWIITAAHCLVEIKGFDNPGDMIAGPSGEMVMGRQTDRSGGRHWPYRRLGA